MSKKKRNAEELVSSQADLEELIEEQEIALDEKNSTLNHLEEANSTLSQHLEKLKEHEQERENEAQKAVQDNSSEKEIINLSRKRVASAQKAVQLYAELCKRLAECHEKVNKRNNELTNSLSEVRSECNSLKLKKIAADKLLANNSCKEENIKLSHEMSNLKEKYDHLKQVVTELEDEHLALIAQKKSAEKKSTDTNLSITVPKLSDRKKKPKKTSKKKSRGNNKSPAKIDEKKELNEKIQRMSVESKELNNKITALKKDKKCLEEKLSETESIVEDNKEKIKELDMMRLELQNQIDNLKQENRVANEVNKKIQIEKNQLESSIQLYPGQNDQLELSKSSSFPENQQGEKSGFIDFSFPSMESNIDGMFCDENLSIEQLQSQLLSYRHQVKKQSKQLSDHTKALRDAKEEITILKTKVKNKHTRRMSHTLGVGGILRSLSRDSETLFLKQEQTMVLITTTMTTTISAQPVLISPTLSRSGSIEAIESDTVDVMSHEKLKEHCRLLESSAEQIINEQAIKIEELQNENQILMEKLGKQKDSDSIEAS